MTDFTERAQQLTSAWASLLHAQPKLRIRDAAAQISCSELELLHSRLGTDLNDPIGLTTQAFCDWLPALEALPTLGKVMALVRNHAVVHEVKGVFSSLAGTGPVRLFLGEQDQRLFLQHWHYLYQVSSSDHCSLQFFNKAGEAIVKIYRQPETDLAAWQALVDSLTPAPTPWPELEPSRRSEQLASELDHSQQALLRQQWAQITDVHQFHGLLRKLNINRLTALTAVGDDWAQPLPLSALDQVLASCQSQRVPLMSFVYNQDAVQIHTSVPERVVRMGKWLNILDRQFNLHIDEPEIDSVWWVCRPSKDGLVHSVEAYDRDGQQLLQFFGARKEGSPELISWRQIVNELKEEAAHA